MEGQLPLSRRSLPPSLRPSSAYMLMTCAFQLFIGRVYTFYSAKIVFLCCIFLFEIGSAICGAAPNSPVFIVGRAIAGLGAAGIFGGAIVLTMFIVPLHKRPVFVSLNGAIFGFSSVIGPSMPSVPLKTPLKHSANLSSVLGGALTTNVTWRWCFYINLPIGGFTIVALLFILKTPPPKNANLTFKERVAQLDIIGTSIFVPCIVCLLLALQWGGSTYPWNDGRIIALLVLFGILLIAFAGVQVWKKDGTLPPRIIKQRSIGAGVFFALCLGASMFLMVYYLPLWFQAIKVPPPPPPGETQRTCQT
jgi:MFS family permease